MGVRAGTREAPLWLPGTLGIGGPSGVPGEAHKQEREAMKCTCGQTKIGKNVRAFLDEAGVWHYLDSECKEAR